MPVATGVTLKVPLGDKVPLNQPALTAFVFPELVQEVAFTDVHATVVVVSAGMEVAPRVRVGAAGTFSAGVTVSTTEAGADAPPRLLQVSVKVSVPTAVGSIVLLPLGASVPLQLPEAVQLVAPSESHAMVVDLPTATDEDARFKFGVSGTAPEVAVRVAERGSRCAERVGAGQGIGLGSCRARRQHHAAARPPALRSSRPRPCSSSHRSTTR